ncbi:MAG: DUF4900 domain-containing protein [Candidatus Eisenbacteria bacterium]|nr:DUF4900 domain-containing protein [Candidatus Eisenbacteria bacterium]
MSRQQAAGAATERYPTGMERPERGAALVTVVVIIAAVILVGAALFILGTGESDVVEYGVDGSRAFYLAEAGVDRARSWLEQKAQQDPPQFPASASVSDQPLGGGDYDVTLTKVAGNPWVADYNVVSTGTIDGVTRQVSVVLRHETFAQYMYFANEMQDIWFISGDSLDGRVHANGHIRLSGSPWFGMKVTSSEESFIVWGDSEPVFEGGYELGVPEIPLPMSPELVGELSGEAASGGVHAGGLSGNSAYYEVVLGRGGNPGYLSYRAYERQGWWGYQWSDWVDVSIASMNGIAWFDEPVALNGVLDGELTIGSSEDIYITDDLTYDGATPGQGPGADCDDILGIVSAGDVVVANTAANRDDVEIHAHMMALDESFTVEDYGSGSPRGKLTIYGGFAQKRQGAIGMFQHGYGIIHGYQKDYHYDPRLVTLSPPGYPRTGKYNVLDWREVYPPVT